MANEDDARKWKNLVDIDSLSISANSSLNDIKIDENWFATHIAISFTYGDLRYITAANHIETGVQPSYWFAYQWNAI